MTPSHGKFVWYELMTSDAKAAEDFYRGVMGWDVEDANVPGMRYMIVKAGGAPAGGLMDLPEEARKMGARPGWIGYVGVDDVDATAAEIVQSGGVVHRAPADISVGRFAIVADPQGAVFALFKPIAASQGETVKPGTPGHAGWRELLAHNGEAAFDFYSKLFGWTKAEPYDMGAMGIYQLFARGGETIGGMMTKPPAVPVPFWLYYFNIDAVDAAIARVQKGGGQIANGPHQVPGGSWIVQCLDPQGALFALVAPKK